MNKTVDFFFDVGSPTSYLAYTQLKKICAETGSDLIYRPMLLGGVFKATSNASPLTVPAKAQYMLKDMDRFAKRYDVPLRFNPHFPINTLNLMRAAAGMQLHQPERFLAFIDCLFTALWIDGLNLNDTAVVASVLKENGFDPDLVFGWVNDPEVKERLKVTTDLALQRGVFGAPSMCVGDDLFFGQDRLDFVREALS
ncbi:MULTISPECIES: 2-hydroxychromene-2-carboxylate isomerase [unclassified Pseudomonas]|uniref:2-hydroxychromene-2-carboxylate isomerase n=1 Tax=unclassified Pseudomonas TaxID=196821 RepID=UPI002AC96CAC|nr:MULTISPECIES: 2-hydroxychromene-2-carboxylate isomerase [unclassified Pseudomonas]MEB0042395.1 2-hydroxychromene-2-carboxylate isomerase [Pseudomonas sp. MH10]MEB0079184.1 2-hydroxychromene-2-carboxylate isomerase [Pseudomonas sp. MH10out]MEB0092372.1 2-hydroxychromene-2-carboxylate isomerase [Pseudomonas sp. CCI4.2]MEB0102129.1 2-hydroxychromene-2-carboxylate isomerase [Pseudomonas sp. CCI3.2]MEB0122114.1 2-hydroxychromene-2-carboxylate isomerase [Pseudomonas sp. CCI1.2]